MDEVYASVRTPVKHQVPRIFQVEFYVRTCYRTYMPKINRIRKQKNLTLDPELVDGLVSMGKSQRPPLRNLSHLVDESIRLFISKSRKIKVKAAE